MESGKLNIIGVIPARYASTRFPGKPLAKINGKPMLAWVVEQARKALPQLIVATDHPEIAALAESLKVQVVMTPSELPTGSDRAYAAVQNIPCDVVINIQGDEPLLDPQMLKTLVGCFEADPQIEMATLGRKLTMDDLRSPNTAKIVVNHKSEALYFSRYPIPYSRLQPEAEQNLRGCLKHVGIYGYKKDFLAQFCKAEPCDLEKAESLEQLRALYLGARIRVAEVTGDSWGVDTPEDVAKIEKLMAERAKGN